MNKGLIFPATFLIFALQCIAAPPPRTIDLTSPDGTKLKATYFSADKPGPGVMLFHQCNRDRKMWDDLAPRLAAEGLNVLALDYRGYGESDGATYYKLPAEEGQKQVREKWPQDIETAYQYLVSQPGVNKNVIGAGGASCGVNQSIQLAKRHPEVKSLVLLSGGTTRDGRAFLRTSSNLPIFASGAGDDGDVVSVLRWILSTSPNPGNRLQRYTAGGHGIEMFAPHPELTGLITSWFETTLLKTPGKAPVNPNRPSLEPNILGAMDEPGGIAKAAEMLAAARKKDPNANLFPQGPVNIMGFDALQEGRIKDAIEALQLNVTAYPNSPNAYDSLSEALAANGQTDLAIQNAEKALKLLESDTADSEDRRKDIRESAEQRLKQLKGK
jgi:dienelactone hydrolase